MGDSMLSLFCKIYEGLYNHKRIPNFVLSPLRRVVRLAANILIPISFNNNKRRSAFQSDIIVSLTTFPARIEKVYLVVECMLRQTYKPKKIILWLAKSQFPNGLPQKLTDLIGPVFEIRFVEEDLRSHKKYYYVLKDFPNDWVLLVDDDLFYPADMIEKMLKARTLYPNAIICRYASILKTVNGVIPRHLAWWKEDIVEAVHDSNLFFGSGGGTLIKKSLFDKRVLDIDLARTLTPIADDIWLNAMANLVQTDKYKVECGLLLPILIKNDERLCSENVYADQNDVQFDAVVDYFKKEKIVAF